MCISDTTVRPRKDTYLFDYDCVNEAVLNALVHRLLEASDNLWKMVLRSRFYQRYIQDGNQ